MLWKNWLGNQRANVHRRAPRTLDALRAEVREGARRGRVRVTGNSYAWSRLIPPYGREQSPEARSGTVISLRHLNRVLGFGEVGDLQTITVECGISIRELNGAAAEYGLALISPTLFPGVAVGGAIGTGSHGTGRTVSTFSDGIVSMTLIDAEGNLREVSEADGDLFHAACCGLGAFGVIYSVTLAVERDFNLYTEWRRQPIERVLRDLDDLLDTYEFVELYWFPFTDHIQVMAMRRTMVPADRIQWWQRVRGWLRDAIVYFSGRVILPFVSHYWKRAIPTMMRFAAWFTFKPGVTVQPSTRVFHYINAYPRNWDMEYGVAWPEAAQAWQGVIDLVWEFREHGMYPINFVVHSRHIGPSSALITPAHGRYSCQLEAATNKDEVPYDDIEDFMDDPVTHDKLRFYQRLDLLLRGEHGGRPHWGKLLARPRDISDVYPDVPWQKWIDAQRAFDPDGVFINEFLQDAVFEMNTAPP